MSCAFHFDPANKLLLVEYSAVVDDAEMVRTYRQTGRIVALTGTQRGIVDFSGVTEFRVTPDTIRLLAAHPTNFPDPIRRCLVAVSDYTYGMCRMFQIAGDDTRKDLHVMRSLASAYALLGLETPIRFYRVDAETGEIGTSPSPVETP